MSLGQPGAVTPALRAGHTGSVSRAEQEPEQQAPLRGVSGQAEHEPTPRGGGRIGERMAARHPSHRPGPEAHTKHRACPAAAGWPWCHPPSARSTLQHRVHGASTSPGPGSAPEQGGRLPGAGEGCGSLRVMLGVRDAVTASPHAQSQRSRTSHGDQMPSPGGAFKAASEKCLCRRLHVLFKQMTKWFPQQRHRNCLKRKERRTKQKLGSWNIQ